MGYIAAMIKRVRGEIWKALRIGGGSAYVAIKIIVYIC